MKTEENIYATFIGVLFLAPFVWIGLCLFTPTKPDRTFTPEEIRQAERDAAYDEKFERDVQKYIDNY